MTNAKTTKRALFTSVIALLLCFTMLIGTTFAWFTDSVTSANNIIKSGSLDIELMWADGSADPATAVWKDASKGAIFNSELWEPGYTDAKHMDIINNGTLALKYQLTIEPTGEVSKLAEVIDVYFIEGATQLARTDLDTLTPVGTLADVINKGIARGSLLAEENYTFTIVLKMRESAGNEYQNLSIGSTFAIKLIATQFTSEEDSFDEYYDGGAAWLGDVDVSWYDPTATEVTIGTPEQLAGLAAIVNGTAVAPATTYAATAPATIQDSFKGKTVKLTSNINLNNIAWTPIGDNPNPFLGNFDGQGYTVSNLYVNNEGWAGLIGHAGKSAGSTIKNVTIDGVTISSNRMAGAVVGQLYGSIDNCHVSDATITVVPNWTGSGYDDGDKVGGIVGWLGDNNNNRTLTNCTVDGLNATAYRDLGGIAGYVAWSTTLENNKVTNSTLIGDQSINFYGKKDYNVNEVWGRNSVSSSGVGVNDVNNAFENVTVKTVNVVANEDDLKAVMAAGGEYNLAADVAVTEPLTLPKGVALSLNLNGKTISQTKSDISASYALITVKGNLTITDAVGTGKISFTDATAYTSDIGWASNTICNEGVLTINGGTVENLTSDEVMNYGYPHAIDCYQGSETTVNGGTVKSLNYDSIRMFCNSDTLATTVTINGGTIVNRISFQDPAAARAGYGILNINGGAFVTTENVTANVRLLNFSNVCSNMKATVTGGTFDKGFKTQNHSSCTLETSDWLTYEGGIPVNSLAELQAALNKAVDGDVIKLIADITGNVTVVQKAGVKVTIDGNDKTFAGTITVDGKSSAYATAGLTIKNLNFDAKNVDDACIKMGGNNNTRYVSNLTVENCTFVGNYPAEEKSSIKSYTGGDKNLTVIGCIATNMHTLVQVKNVTGLTVTDCKAINCKNGISAGTSSDVTITGCNIVADGYGIRLESNDPQVTNPAIVIADCEIEAFIPVVMRNAKRVASVTFNGTNTMTATNSDNIWFALGVEEYGDVAKENLTKPAATITVTLNDTGLDANGVYDAN